jgi:hypothetical protein
MPGALYAWVDERGHADAPIDARGGAPDTAPLLLDEAQRFHDRRALRRVLASARTVVFSSHEDLSSLCAHPVTTHDLDHAPRSLLDDVVRARLAWARRDTGDPVAPPADLLDALHTQHRGNLRAIEHVLYDWYQRHWS